MSLLLLAVVGAFWVFSMRLFGKWLIRRGARMRGRSDRKAPHQETVDPLGEGVPNPFGEE